MMIQVLGGAGIGERVIALVVPVLLVAFGTDVGVPMGLQSFFDAESWQGAILEGEQWVSSDVG